MDEIYFKKDESTEDKTNDTHTYVVYLTNGKMFFVKATDYVYSEDSNKFLEFYDGDLFVASIEADLIYAILDTTYTSEKSSAIVYKEIK